MSYSKCFICHKDNFSGNETRIQVQRVTVDKENGTSRTLDWRGVVCDGCLNKYLTRLDVEVGE